jgi:hypothetical protein
VKLKKLIQDGVTKKMKKKSKSYYMHLMNGIPAAWDKQYKCIYFSGKSIKVEEMCTSLSQLKRQQKLDMEECAKMKRMPDIKYSYMIVRV